MNFLLLRYHLKRRWPNTYSLAAARFYASRNQLRAYIVARPPLRHVAVRLRGLFRFSFLPVQVVTFTPKLVRFELALKQAPVRGRQARAAGAFEGAQEAREIVMLVISEVWRDPRVERGARALADAGFRVKIIYPDYFSTIYGIDGIDWGPGVTFRPLPGAYHGYIHSFPYLLGADYIRAVCEERPFAIHAHDLSTALIGLAAASEVGAHCVCDFHEWFSQNASWDPANQRFIPHPALKRWTYWWAERVVLRHASAVVTVCDSIGQELERMSGSRRKVTIIRNIPKIHPVTEDRQRRSIRTELGIPADRFLLLYQGGTGPSRLLEPVIEALAYAPRVTLVIRGPGNEYYGAAYERHAVEHGVAHQLICLPPIPSAEVVEAAWGADAGIYTVANVCKNFFYALPNKAFEYLAAGLPLLVAAYPEVTRLVEKYEVGLTFDPYDPRSIAAAINRLVEEPELAERFRKNTRAALEDINADKEWHKLVELYRGLEVCVAR